MLKYFNIWVKYVVQINFAAAFYFHVAPTKLKIMSISTMCVFLQAKQQHVFSL